MKRVLSLVLALVLIMGVLALASCGGNGDGTTTPKPVITGDGKTEATTTYNPAAALPGEAEGPLAGYEDVDFGGYTFTFAAHINATDSWPDYEVYADEDSGGILDAAIIERNNVMYDNYNCFIEVEDIELNTIGNDFNTNSCNVDIGSYKYNMGSKGTSGQYYDFYTLDVNLNNPWWDQGIVRDGTVDGQLHYMLGAFSLVSFDATWVLFFNKSVQENDPDISGIDFYQLVYNNEWTLEKFYEIIKKAGQDDGNSTMETGTGDIFGLVSSDFGPRGLYFGAGQGYTIKTDDAAKNSTFTHAFNDAAAEAAEQIVEIYSHDYVKTAGYSTVYSQITSGLTLFAPETLNKASMFAGATGGTATVQVGVLPHPKLTADQAEYRHTVDNHMIYICVPKTCKDLDRISKFLELYAYHSYHTVYAKYLELYKYEYTTDTDTAEMVDIILKSRTFDLAYYYGWGGNVDSEFRSRILEGENIISTLGGELGKAIENSAVTYKENLKEAGKK